MVMGDLQEREGEKGDKEREGIAEGISWIHLSFPVITQKEKKSVATKKQKKIFQNKSKKSSKIKAKKSLKIKAKKNFNITNFYLKKSN